MILLVSGATATVDRLAGHPRLGRLITPDGGNAIAGFAGWECGADNSALGKDGINPDRLLRMWDGIAAAGLPRLRFVTAPDAVMQTDAGPRGDWQGTLWLWRCWRPALVARNLPAAIVLQDGATIDSVPWDAIAAVFVGGSTAWKLSTTAALLIRAAHARGKWVHVGRVNTMKRIRHFDPLPVHSIDGTQFSMFGDTYIPRYLARLEHRQEGLWSISS